MTCHVCASGDTALFCKKNNFDIFRCHECGLLFVYPLPVSTTEIYAKDYFEGAHDGFGYVDYDADKEPMIPTFEKYLRLIRDKVGGGGTLLDVGAATGFFVGMAKRAGFTSRGVELSAHAAERARQKGLDVQTGTLADVSGTFDCITMLDVIEHVPDPRAELARAASLLKVGGLLIINTPDVGSLFARLLGKRWHLIVPPEHLYYFSRATMRRLLSEVGFEVEMETTIGKSFTPQYILKTLYKWTKLKVFEWLANDVQHSFISRLSIPINLHDNMFVIARKRV
jgi:2-polyprenyl-3-methyl-5-hydroxy-6-metoxy-1,4-benzoquinol methylase